MIQSESTNDLQTPPAAEGLTNEADANTEDVVHRRAPIVETIINDIDFGWYQVLMIIILGVAHSTDTMETIIQAILGPSLRCDWRLSADYVALLTSLVFLGSCLGTIPLGYAADVYGRRPICLFSCLMVMYLSWLCAISPTYSWIASLRFLSGIFIGGVLTSGSSLLSEIMPSKYQAIGQLVTTNFEALVGVLTAAIGLGCSRGALNWRFFVFFTTAPLAFCATGLVFFTLESPVFLYCKKKTLEAAKVLDSIAIRNRRMPSQMPPVPGSRETGEYEFSFAGRLKETDETEDFRISKVGAKEIYALLMKRHPWVLPVLLVLNFLWGFLIYGGTTLLPVELATSPRTCLQDVGKANATSFLPTDQLPGSSVFECCKPLKEEGYRSLLTSASGGLLSLPVAYVFIRLFGRRSAQAVIFLLIGCLLFVQSFCMPSIAINIVFFVIRAVASAGCGITGIYTSNIFQSRVRSLCTGLCATAFRLGILAAPYLGQVFLQQHSVLLTILIFAFTGVLGAGCALCLPRIRSKGKASSLSQNRGLPSARSLLGRRSHRLPTEDPSRPFLVAQPPRSLTTLYPDLVHRRRTPSIALVETTYNELREREGIRHDDLVHEDFIRRSINFEVDA